jgi:hypothetical protein
MSNDRRRSPRLDPLEGRRLPSTTLPLASSAKATAYHQGLAKPGAEASPTSLAAKAAVYHQSAASTKAAAAPAATFHQSTHAAPVPSAKVAGASNIRVNAAAATAQGALDVTSGRGAASANLRAGQIAGSVHQAASPATPSAAQVAAEAAQKAASIAHEIMIRPANSTGHTTSG